jgi:hypothetical protein
VVELRYPVVGLVLGYCGGSTTAGSHRLVGDTLTESGTTSDSVNVTRDRSRVHDTASQLMSVKQIARLTDPIEWFAGSFAT